MIAACCEPAANFPNALEPFVDPTNRPNSDAAPADPTDGASPPTKDPGLPPVQPPTAGFLLQLFLIPMVIVTIIVLVWFAFSWLAHQGVDPHDLARSLRTRNDASWQKAYNLSNMLRTPKNAELKRDPLLAKALIFVLEQELRVQRSNSGNQQDVSQRAYETEARVRLREYLAKTLGEFELDIVAPTLVKAAEQELVPEDVAVRRKAVEALAVLSSQVDLTNDSDVLDALLTASRDRSSSGDKTDRLQRNELRAAAAFALGVLGTEQALNRLEAMLSDTYGNARYNAATALARHGDPRSVETLAAMLDPDNEDVTSDEVTDEGREFKRAEVLGNAIRSIRKFAQNNQDADLSPIKGSLQKLVDANLSRDVTLAAKETLALLRDR